MSQSKGKSADEYLRTLIEAELLSQQTFAEIPVPIREGFRKSGMTEEQLGALFEEARQKVHQEEQAEKNGPFRHSGCHGLVPWSAHDSCYRRSARTPQDATGLAPWSAHDRCYRRSTRTPQDATGLSRGVLTIGATGARHARHKMPRACPVECSRWLLPALDTHATRCHSMFP